MKVTYRLDGKLHTSFLSSEAAHATIAAAISQGCDYHVIQGCWNVELRRHEEK